MKPAPRYVGSDFAGQESNKGDSLWRIWAKSDVHKGKVVYVFAYRFFDARAIAATYFIHSDGFHVSYDQLDAEALDEGEITIAVGSVFLRKDPKGGALAFKTTGELDREGARRGTGFRKWEHLARKGGRKDTRVPHRVQEDRQEVVQLDVGDVDQTQARGPEVGTYTNGAGRVREGEIRHPLVGSSNGSPGESG